MQPLTLFKQNFAIAESLMQLHRLFSELKQLDLPEDLRLAICSVWGTPKNTALQHASNDRVMICAKAATPIPETLTLEGGLDFLLRQAIIVSCTALESFFWDALRENVLIIVKARRTGADKSLRDLTFTLGDYISIQQYEDPDVRLKQIILKNFERSTLYNVDSIDRITSTMTVNRFWERVEEKTGEPAKHIKRQISELIDRRNKIAHRADRPEDGEEADGQGLRHIQLPWVNVRVQACNTLVNASNEIIKEAIQRLESDIRAAEEQAEARMLAEQLAKDGSTNEG